MALRAAIPKTVRISDESTERDNSVAEEKRENAAHQGGGQSYKGQDCQAPTREDHLQQQHNADRGGERVDEHFPLGILAFGIFPQNFGIVLQRKLNTCQALLDVADHGSEVPAPRIKTNVDATPEILAGDDVGAWLDADVSNVFQRNVVAPRRVDQEFADAATLCRVFGVPHT